MEKEFTQSELDAARDKLWDDGIVAAATTGVPVSRASVLQAHIARLETRLEEANKFINKMEISASGGLCQFTLTGKHCFLQDIQKACEKWLSDPEKN